MANNTKKAPSPKGKTPVPYFSLTTDENAKTADFYIFGDIASERGGLSGLFQATSDQSSYNLANQIARVPGDYEITVHINSNGGEMKEGLGIYNVLKDRGVTTVCDGFAASAGSIIFAAGRRRIMKPASLLFIHQASMEARGNADDFAKYAGDLKTITDAAVAAYKESGVNVSDEELVEMLQFETWITPEDAVRMGFATEIAADEAGEEVVDGVPVIRNDMMRSLVDLVGGRRRDFDLSDFMDSIDTFNDLYSKHGSVIALARGFFEKVEADPELLTKVKAVADIVLATNPTPPARDGIKKGFFNFRAGNGNT